MATLSIGDVVLVEGDSGETQFLFDVTLDEVVGAAFTVDYTTVDDTALENSDYVAASGTLQFTGDTAGEIQTITVNVGGDADVELDETFFVDLSNVLPGGLGVTIADARGVGTITNDDLATLSIGDVTLTEGNSGTKAFTFTVSLDKAASEDITVVANTVPGTATGGGGDYASVVNQTLTIAAGSLSTAVTVNVNGDNLVEANETFTVNLSDARYAGATDVTRATIGDGVGVGTITNDDLATISIGDVTLTEGNSGTKAFTFTVSLDKAASEDVTVVANTVPGTATGGGGDYASVVNQTLTIAAGSLSTAVTVNVNGDNLVEANETFTVNLSDARIAGVVDGTRAAIGDGVGVGTITNDDTGLSIVATDAVKPEGDEGFLPFTFTVTRSGVVSGTTTVDYLVDHDHGLAQAHEPDFKNGSLPAGQVTFAPGQTSKLITVNVAGEVLGEVDEGFTIRLANPTGGAVIIQETANGIIQNDDAPTMSIFALDAAKDEGNSGSTSFEFAVTRSGDVAGVTSTVEYEVTAPPGSDIADPVDFGGLLPSGTVTFDPGETLKTIVIDVSGDLDRELNEKFTVSLKNPTGNGVPSGGTIGIGAAVGTIKDDDGLRSFNFTDFSDVSQFSFNGNARQAETAPGDFVLRLTENAAQQKGSIYFDLLAPVGPDTSFSTDFKFKIGGGPLGSDGFTFLLHNNVDGTAALGGVGSALGYDDVFTPGGEIETSLAIEFDTAKNGSYDPDNNHISVLRDGDVTTPLAVTSAGAITALGIDMNNGGEYSAWIDYDGDSDLLEVYISDSDTKPLNPILTHSVDLFDILGTEAYVGFTAANWQGFLINSHDILEWAFELNPTPNLTYRADASAFEVSGGSGSTGTANLGFVLSPEKTALDYVIDISALNLKEDPGARTGNLDVTRITLREGPVGSIEANDVPVVFTILDDSGLDETSDADSDVDWERDIISGSWNASDAEDLSSYLAALAAGDLYVFVETVDPANNVRGQIAVSKLTFDGMASADEIVPNGVTIPDPDLTNSATAVVALNLNEAGTEIEYFIDIDGLTLAEEIVIDEEGRSRRIADDDGEIWGVHLHRGAPGTNGSHALNIFGNVGKNGYLSEDDNDLFIDFEKGILRGTWGDPGDNTLGTMMGSEELQNVLDELLAGDIYIQIHAVNEFGEDVNNIRGQITFSDNSRPNAPIITEPLLPGTESHFSDVHMEAPIFIDPDGDQHLYTDFEIWTADGSEMVWDGRNTGGFEKIHAHFADGEFVGSRAGTNQLLPNTDYVIRVRYIDSDGAFSDYSEQTFVTSPANAIVALTPEDVLVLPTPTWEEVGTGDTALDPGQFIIIRSQFDSTGAPNFTDPDFLLYFDENGATDGKTLPGDEAIRVDVNLIGAGPSKLNFETEDGRERSISFEAGANGSYWVSTNGSTYREVDPVDYETPEFDTLAHGTFEPYLAVQAGFEIEVAHDASFGFTSPVDIAFVPAEIRGTDPLDPLYYVTELYGEIKVVTNDGSVFDYVPPTLPSGFISDNPGARWNGLLNYNPGDAGLILGGGQQGLSGLTVDSNGDIYVNYAYNDPLAGTQYARLVKLTSSPDGLSAIEEDTVIDLGAHTGRAGEDSLGEDIGRVWNNPAVQGISHFLSKVSLRDSLGDTIDGLGGDDVISGLGGDDSLVGGSGNDRLDGGTGGDILDGGADNDTLDGGTGADTLIGGTGADVFVYAAGYGQDEIADFNDGADTIQLNINLGRTSFADIDTNNNNVLDNGDDGITILNDTTTVIDFGGGSHTLSIQAVNLNAADFSFFGGSVGTESADILIGLETADAAIDGLGGNDRIDGRGGDDSLVGGLGNDKIDGGAGDDTLDGGDNDDTLDGGSGNDSLIGGTGNDVFVYASGYGRDEISDFSPGADTVQLNIDLGIASFDDIDTNGNNVIDDGDDEVTIEGGATTVIDFGSGSQSLSINAVNLDATSFSFVGGSVGTQSPDVLMGTMGIYLHMGDGYNTSTPQQLDHFQGKILRLNLDGSPVETNPFYNSTVDFDDDQDGAGDDPTLSFEDTPRDDDPDDDGIDAADFIYTLGYRNPFGGDWRDADNSLYVAENGEGSNDRLSKTVYGENYAWTGGGGFFGQAPLMVTNAIHNWTPTEAPVDMAFIQSGTYDGSGFPEELWDNAFITLLGPQFADGVPLSGTTGEQRGKEIVYFDLEDPDGNGNTPLIPGIESGPKVFVTYVGAGHGSFSGIAAGPDGLYFATIFDDLDANGQPYTSPFFSGAAGSQILRVRYEAIGIVADSANKNEGTGGTTPFTFTVTRDGDLSRETTVQFHVLGGAVEESDFGGSFPSGVVTFAEGESSQTIQVDVVSDSSNETDENFVVRIFGASSGQIVDSEATGTIRNDDTPTLSVAPVDSVKNEATGGSTPFTFEVTRSGDPSVALTVDWEVIGADVDASDFVFDPISLPNGTISLLADQLTATITIDVAADSVVELDENFSVELVAAPGAVIAQTSAEATIQNDDSATLSIGDVTLDEGDGGTTLFLFTVTLDSAVDTAFDVDFATADGTGTVADGDYTPTGGTLSFAGTVGEVRTVTVAVAGDAGVELDETFVINLSNIQAAGRNVTIADGQGVGTILNDDAETASGTSFSFGPNTADFDYLWNDGAAPLQVNPNAATPGSGRLTLTNTQPQQSGSAYHDTPLTVEAGTSFSTEFKFQLGGGTNGGTGFTFVLQNAGLAALGGLGGLGYGGTGAIQPSVAIEFDTVDNGAYDPDNNHISVLRDGNVSNPLAFTAAGALTALGIDLNSGAAYTAWVDYDGNTDLIQVFISSTDTKPGAPVLTDTVDLHGIVGNQAYAGFTASNWVGGLINSHEILEWEMMVSSSVSSALTVSISPSSISEDGGLATGTVTRTDGTSGNLIVNLNSNDTSEAAVPATVVIPDGSASATFDVTAADDTIVDGDQTVTITASATGYTSGNDTVDVTDDAAILSIGDVTLVEGNAGTTQFIFDVTLDRAVDFAFTVDYATADGSATLAGSDYVASSGTLNFTGTAGEVQTITVDVTGDTDVEFDESFFVNISNLLTNGSEVAIGDGQGVGTILSDDATSGTSFSFGPNTADFDFLWNDGAAPLQVNPNAATPGSGRLTLTNTQPQQSGSAYHDAPLTVEAGTSFSTEFKFQLGGGTNGGTGFTFVLQNAGLAALGGLGGLGYGGTGAIQPSVAIEFDTVDNGAYDPDNNHISVLRDGNVSNPLAFTAAGALTALGIDLNSGAAYTAWVDYDGNTDLIQVFISSTDTKPGAPVLTDSVDLHGIVGNQAYAGFTASNWVGGLINSHEILEWEMMVSSSVSSALTVSISPSSISEDGGLATGTVTRTDGTSGNLIVNLSSNDTSEVAVPATVVIPDGSASATFDVTAADDTIVDGDQTVTITASATGYTSGNDTVDVTDDAAILSIGDVTLVEGNAGTTQFIFDVTLDRAVDFAFTVDYATADGSATLAGSDYVASSGTLNFTGTAGEVQTITVDVTGDTDVEFDESFFVNISNLLTNGSEVAIGDGQGVGTILSDDATSGTSFSFGPNTADFDFLWNDGAAPLQVNPNAATPGSGRLTLTNTQPQQSGSAYHDAPLTVEAGTSFSTEFKFQLGGGTNGGTGFTFVLQNDVGGATEVGGLGGLGYGGTGAIQPSVAIEFDTVDNGAFDPDNNHISVLRDGNVSNPLAVTAAGALTALGIDLNSGAAYTAWVDYDGNTDLMEVFISATDTKPGTPVLTDTVDLFGIVGEQAYAGFTASNWQGGLINSHEILEWEMMTLL